MLCVAKLHIINVATMFFFVQALDRKICVYLCNLWETKIIIRVGEIIFSLFIIPSRTR